MRTLATGKSEALATLERVAEISEPDILAAMLARPIEHQIDIDRRELAKRDEGWAQEREREAARAPAATSQADWSGWEAWLAARLATERAFVLECVGTALGQALQKERAAARRELADEIRRLRVEYHCGR